MGRLVIVLAVLAAACSGSSPTAPSVSTAPPPVVVPPPLAPALPTRGPEFSLVFWNEFAHNTLDAPGSIAPLRRLTGAPMLYLKTVDEAGQAIDPVTLDTVQSAMLSVAGTWSGGSFGLAGVQRGTSSMAGQRGWLTVKWPNPAEVGRCGFSDVGVDGGSVSLNYLNPNCTCGSASKIYARLARHELGHAFGYWHTDDINDVMYGQRLQTTAQCDALPSARERYHATLMYQTPVGSLERAGASGSAQVID